MSTYPIPMEKRSRQWIMHPGPNGQVCFPELKTALKRGKQLGIPNNFFRCAERSDVTLF